MITPIKQEVLPNTDLGNDPNDNRSNPHYLDRTKPVSAMNWPDEFELSDEEVEELGEPEWVYDNLIIRGHILVLPAPPNGGKTTLALWIASEIAANNEVIYVNADVSGPDAKAMIKQAKNFGFQLVCPDLKAGKSIDDVVRHLNRMNLEGGDFGHIVLFIDTLKKVTEIINKSANKKIMNLFRGLSAKGMTIILLGHTNKYTIDGNLIYEGTGDIRSDVDEMIYLYSTKHDDGSMTLSTQIAKCRHNFETLSFEVSVDRLVTPRDYVDIHLQAKALSEKEKDQGVIDVIMEALETGHTIQKNVCNYCQDHGFGQQKVINILKRYSNNPGQLWVTIKAENNANVYTKLES